jgi:hypothetical protein
MTRSKLRRTLRWTYVALIVVLAVSLVTKLAPHIPGIAGSPLESIAKDVYEYLKDMALVFVTVVAAALAGIYQRRQSFIAALKEEWRDIIKAKSELIYFTHLQAPDHAQYMRAFTAISETLDNMRSVYGNVGETKRLIGYYPYEPLHDMRRVLQSLDPRKVTPETRVDPSVARDAIIRSFQAVRESFLEELELEPPDKPILAVGSIRRKTNGGRSRWSDDDSSAADAPNDAVTGLLRDLKARERMALLPPSPLVEPTAPAVPGPIS